LAKKYNIEYIFNAYYYILYAFCKKSRREIGLASSSYMSHQMLTVSLF